MDSSGKSPLNVLLSKDRRSISLTELGWVVRISFSLELSICSTKIVVSLLIV